MKRKMDLQLKMEELAMLLFSFGLFSYTTQQPWWVYVALFFVPDVSFVAYAVNTRVGAFYYNLLHHKGVALVVFATGWFGNLEWLMVTGSVFFGHASFDRIFGYGLKYSDDFKHTHLGYIGKTE